MAAGDPNGGLASRDRGRGPVAGFAPPPAMPKRSRPEQSRPRRPPAPCPPGWPVMTRAQGTTHFAPHPQTSVKHASIFVRGIFVCVFVRFVPASERCALDTEVMTELDSAAPRGALTAPRKAAAIDPNGPIAILAQVGVHHGISCPCTRARELKRAARNATGRGPAPAGSGLSAGGRRSRRSRSRGDRKRAILKFALSRHLFAALLSSPALCRRERV